MVSLKTRSRLPRNESSLRREVIWQQRHGDYRSLSQPSVSPDRYDRRSSRTHFRLHRGRRLYHTQPNTSVAIRAAQTESAPSITPGRPGIGSYVCSVWRRRPGSSFGHSAARTDPAGRRRATGTAGTGRDLRTARSDRRNLTDRSINEILRLDMNVHTGLLL